MSDERITDEQLNYRRAASAGKEMHYGTFYGTVPEIVGNDGRHGHSFVIPMDGAVTTRALARFAAQDTAQRAAEHAASETPRPAARHTFEFRLGGSETQEQGWPGGGPRAGQVAIQRVRAYLSRPGADPADPSVIAGLEVHAERRAAGIVCTAQLSDFGPAETVVVQVEVEVV
jgi:hypothetical protein